MLSAVGLRRCIFSDSGEQSMTAPYVGLICMELSGSMTGKNGIAAGLREKSDEVSRRTKERIAGNYPPFLPSRIGYESGRRWQFEGLCHIMNCEYTAEPSALSIRRGKAHHTVRRCCRPTCKTG